MTSPSLSDILLLVRKNCTCPAAMAEYDNAKAAYHAGWQDALIRLKDVLRVLGVEIDTV